MQTKKRPVYLDMPTIIRHLPIPGIVSILHRASGVMLFLLLPVLLSLLAGSLSSGQAFAEYKAWADNWFMKLILIGVLWLFIHHLFAGHRRYHVALYCILFLLPARPHRRGRLHRMAGILRQSMGESLYPGYLSCTVFTRMGRRTRFVDGLHQALLSALIPAMRHRHLAGRLHHLLILCYLGLIHYDLSYP